MPAKKNKPQTAPSTPTRPPIIVVMGHVDHGKTSLLDAIRKTDVAAGEHGGITQSIGAYQVTVGNPMVHSKPRSTLNNELVSTTNRLTFIDTPGHQAFTAMRSRGAKVADIAVLVVAANDSVMPQTAESIKIIQEAKIPYIVAINKVDLPEANVDKVVQDLLKHNVLLENYGGDVPWIKVSAKTKTGIAELLDLLDLVWQMQEVKTDPGSPLEAIVIESKLDKNRGPVASVIVRQGSLKTGEKIFIDGVESKIRGLFDYLQKPLKEATPGLPVEIIGLAKVPPTGSAVSSELITPSHQAEAAITNKDINQENILNVVIKADTLGSLEAINFSLPKNVTVISSGVGQITANDILLAKDTKSIILGFNTNVDSTGKNILEKEKVIVRIYKIIYELLDELADAAAGILVINQEELLGRGQILAQFPFNNQRVAGTKVTEGRLARGDTIRIVRGDQVVGESKIKSLRIGKEEANKAETGKECGIFLDPQIDFTLNDAVEAYKKY